MKRLADYEEKELANITEADKNNLYLFELANRGITLPIDTPAYVGTPEKNPEIQGQLESPEAHKQQLVIEYLSMAETYRTVERRMNYLCCEMEREFGVSMEQALDESPRSEQLDEFVKRLNMEV